MTISVPTAFELVSTDVVDSTQPYIPTERVYYHTDTGLPDAWRMQDLNKIYSYNGATFTPDVYVEANEQTYVVNQVLFKDATTVKVTSVGAKTVLKQPEEYTAVADTTFTFNTWTKPFSKIQTAIPAGTYNGFTKVVDGVTHKLFRDSTSSTGWRYKITRSVTVLYWSNELYQTQIPATYIGWTDNQSSPNYLEVRYKGTVKFQLSSDASVTPYVSIYTGTDGVRYRCGKNMETLTYSRKYGIQREESRVDTYTYQTEARVYTSLDNTSVITNAYCADTSDCADRWLGRTFVLRGSNLYVRTNSGSIETKVVNVPQYSAVNDLEEFPNFSPIGNNLGYAPVDEKNYTKATAVGTMSYTIKGTVKFDTLALGRVNADSATIVFKNSIGETVTSLSKTIDTSRDTDNNLEKWHTTAIYYSDIVMEADSTVEITLTGINIELGTIMLGMSVGAGFTHLELSNSFIDYSVIQEDTFGNIDYVERAKVAVYKGNCDIHITNYDRTDRLLSSLGGKTIILNGSDAKNTTPDSQNIFASTQKIGRLFDLEQKTKTKEDEGEDMAGYSFTLKEIV